MGDANRDRERDELIGLLNHDEALRDPENAALGRLVLDELRSGKSLRDAILTAYDRAGRPRPNRHTMRSLLTQWAHFERFVTETLKRRAQKKGAAT